MSGREVDKSAQLAFPWLSLLLALLATIAIPVLVLAAARIPGLLSLEYSSADMRTALFSTRTTRDHPSIAIVAISDDTLASFATKSPIDRGFLARLVTAVDDAAPRAIGLDVFFLRPTTPENDTALQRAVASATAPIVLAALDERLHARPEQRAYQTAFVATSGRPAGHITITHERDDVVRNNTPPQPGSKFPDSLSLLLARTVKPQASSPNGYIAWLQKVDGARWYSWLVNINSNSPFVTVRAEDLLDPAKPGVKDKLTAKIVLIGANFSYGDRHRTPLTALSGRDMAGVAIHAQVLAQILDGRSVVELGASRARLLTLALACLGGILGWRFRHRRFDFLGWSIAAAALIAIDAMIFSSIHLVLPFMLSMLAWFSGVTCGHNFGLVYEWENRRSARTR